MSNFLNEERFNCISMDDKCFIVAFDEAMTRLGYDFGGQIGSGYCWGRYMLIYRRSGVKSEKVYARIYIRDQSIVLRLFLNDIDKHRKYIEGLPAYIKEVFTGDHGKCNHDRDDKEEVCKFRKSYTLEGHLIEKCNGVVFEFHQPDVQKLPDYINLFTEFYPNRKRK
jgi:hypothetical protein